MCVCVLLVVRFGVFVSNDLVADMLPMYIHPKHDDDFKCDASGEKSGSRIHKYYGKSYGTSLNEKQTAGFSKKNANVEKKGQKRWRY